MIDAADLADATEPADSLALPEDWRTASTGEPMPDWVALVREVRSAR